MGIQGPLWKSVVKTKETRNIKKNYQDEEPTKRERERENERNTNRTNQKNRKKKSRKKKGRTDGGGDEEPEGK